MPAADVSLLSPAVSLPDIHAAQSRIGKSVVRTPLLKLPLPGDVWVKAENLQRTGSFKLRGALNAISRLESEQLKRGVVTHSSGNHGQGLACAAALLGTKATIVIPEGAPEVKVERTLKFGARVVRCGASAAEREAAAEAEAAEHGLALIPPFDHPDVIAGQGTVGLEIVEQLPGVKNVLVPVGGGGLLAGVALAVRSLSPQTAVYGVEPELAADAAESFRQGRSVRWDAADTNRTVADGVRTQQIGDSNLPLILENCRGFLTVSEDAILAATRYLAREAKLVAEPTGALTLAAWLSQSAAGGQLEEGPTVLVLSGGNVDPLLLSRLLGS